jgi:hypothetical protein
MPCRCPVCRKKTTSVGTLFSHIVNIRDIQHERWLASYCQANNIDLGIVMLNRVKGIKGANKPLTNVLKRDYCE